MALGGAAQERWCDCVEHALLIRGHASCIRTVVEQKSKANCAFGTLEVEHLGDGPVDLDGSRAAADLGH